MTKKTPPDDPKMIRNDAGPQEAATVVLCLACGSANHVPTKTTSKAIYAKCSKCSAGIKLQGVKMGKVGVGRATVKRLVQLALMPLMETPKKKTEDKDREAPKIVVLTVRCTEEQHGTITRALEIAARMCNEQGRVPLGRRLELICADFLAGVEAEIQSQIQGELEIGGTP